MFLVTIFNNNSLNLFFLFFLRAIQFSSNSKNLRSLNAYSEIWTDVGKLFISILRTVDPVFVILLTVISTTMLRRDWRNICSTLSVFLSVVKSRTYWFKATVNHRKIKKKKLKRNTSNSFWEKITEDIFFEIFIRIIIYILKILFDI